MKSAQPSKVWLATVLVCLATRTLLGLGATASPHRVADQVHGAPIVADRATAASLRLHQAKRILGMTVENLDGQQLGVVKGFVHQPSSARLAYVLVSSGGFLGVGTHLRAVPAEFFFVGTTKKGTIAASIPGNQWQHAPEISRREIPDLSKPEMIKRLYEFYHQAPRTLVAHANGSPLTPTGRTTEKLAAAQNEMQTKLIGREVMNRQQESIGTVLDLLIDFSGARPTMVVMSADRLLRDDQTFAAPLSGFSFGKDGRLILDADRGLLENASPLNAKRWVEAASLPRAIYSYDLTAANNTRRNSRNRSSRALTPLNQAETAGDRELTQQLRQRLMRNDRLSFTAKNIKIITINGQMTLRGAVAQPAERQMIIAAAFDLAGSDKVHDELEEIQP